MKGINAVTTVTPTSDKSCMKNFSMCLFLCIVSDSASTSHAAIREVHEPCGSTASDSRDGFGGLKCMLCRKEPPNGCIIHGGTGHQVCCVVCAQKLKDSNRPCPVCRKKIGKVIKNFM